MGKRCSRGETGALLKEAWSSRIAQDLARCRRIHASLRNRIETIEHEISYQLLTASLRRAEGEVAEAKRMVGEVESRLSSLELPATYELRFQQGIHLLIEGEFSEALERFLAARSLASLTTCRLASTANIIFCLESLGLSTESSWSEFRGEWARLGAETDETRAIAAQTEAFERRAAFRRGDLETAVRTTSSLGTTQASYYRLWVASLPYHRSSSREAEEDHVRFSLAEPHFFQKAYRLRTLRGIHHPSDSDHYKVTELADRLYLWTWRWLCDPSCLGVDKLLSCLGGVSLPALRHRLTYEDYQLIRNALLWLALFDPIRSRRVEGTVEALRPADGRESSLLGLELELIRYFRLLRDGEAAKAEAVRSRMVVHPLWASPSLCFRGLVEPEAQGDPLSGLAEALASLRQDALIADVGIDLATYRIFHSKTEKEVISEPMCLALDLFRRHPVVTVAELVAAAFGYGRYDALAHDPKVFNLLARLRQLELPQFDARVKSGRVYVKADWEGMRFLDRHRATHALHASTIWRELFSVKTPKAPAAGRKKVAPSVLLDVAKRSALLSREEIQSLTGTTRSTATRLVSKWLREGWLERRGQAKNTKYRVRIDSPESTQL